MEYTFYLPNKDGTEYQGTLNNNSLIIIGANGAGKSHLGAWIENRNVSHTHRIGAQRSLNFGDYIQQKSYEQSTNLLLYGKDKPEHNHNGRWSWDGTKYNYTASLLNDYEYVLSALLAKKSLQHEKYVMECKELEQQGKPHNSVPEMITDKLIRIWNNVFPHRDIRISDGKVTAIFKKDGQETEYKGRDMSDGERVVLYLIAQALSVPENKTLIIDEPEIHLHRSIMNRLWTAIEKERQDCLFIYITHDTQFAANHKEAKKIWVKSYDGTKWDWEEVVEAQLPEQLLLDILGNRKHVIFVEGTSDSYDTKLYSMIFKDYYVVACGSCTSVIMRTKAMNKTTQLHDLICYGIIDRDYRSDYEIEKLKEDNIFTLEVAEVENLFLVPEILDTVNSIMGYQDSDIVEQIKNYVINDRFLNEMHRQVCESVVAEIKYRLSTAEISNKNGEEAKAALDDIMSNLNYEELHRNTLENFASVYESKDYKKILKKFNRKELSKSVGHFWKMDNKEYCNFILRQFKTDKEQLLIEAISLYLPMQIPR